MATKVISTILTLKDNMSGGIVKASKNMEGMSKEAKAASKQVASMANKFKRSADAMISKSIKLGAAAATALGGLAIKTGLSEAFDLEGYRTQLETATKDTEKATKIMTYAIDLANKTPYEGGQMIEAASKFESMGMDAYKWLSLSGDMAAATNKDLIQATEALIDAQTGELERLKEFGITKAMVVDKANELWSGVQVVDKGGSITDLAKFNEALVELMQQKYTGGMEKMANTTRGMWSTITGIAKSGLSRVVGMQEDGTVKTGSLLDLVRNKLQAAADKMQEWQNDGTFDKVADKAAYYFGVISDGISTVAGFISEHKEGIKTIAVVVGTFYAASKAAMVVKGVLTGIQVVWGILNGTMALTPLGWIVIGITAVVAAIYLLHENWDKVTTFVKNEIEIVKTNFSNMATAIKTKATEIWEGIKSVFSSVSTWVDNNIIQPLASLVPDWLKNIFSGGSAKADITVRDERRNPRSAPGKNALGTPYWKGGPSWVGERGPELLNLPSGSKITPMNRVRESGTNINVYLTVQGNLYSNEQAKREFGEYIASEVLFRLKSA